MNLVKDEELPEVKSAAELDETAEYINSRNKEEEDPLLTAQRYLNIYHQIHIFKKNKKNEFDVSLMAMPDNIKDMLPHLPGGRILLEHMVELEEKAGIQNSYTQQLLKANPPARTTMHTSSKNENQSGTLSLSKDFAKELAEALAEALKENNAEKPLAELVSLLKQLILQTKSPQQYPAGNRPAKRVALKSSVASEMQINERNTNAVNNYATTEEDIDINTFLQNSSHAASKTPNNEPQVVINPRTKAPLQFKNQLSAADLREADLMSASGQEKPETKQVLNSSKPTYTEALKKIKNAIDPTASVSINNLDVKPVSLNPQDSQTSDDEDWVYVDENGNPITDIASDEEWEYVDEDGNPIKL